MQRVFRRYEERKRREARIDFEDVLELLVRLYEQHPDAAARFRSRCRAITVDEYQDVNLLQQALLDVWLGERDELCVVGDDYQAIYSFTGATPRYLIELPKRFPHAAVIRLETNYRSTPEVLGLANRLVPRLGGAPKQLRSVAAGGPEPVLERVADEPGWVRERVAELHAGGVAYEEIAVLYRVNARSEDFEEVLADAGIPYQVRGGAFIARPAARAVLRRLRRAPTLDAGDAVREAAALEGLLDVVPDGLGEEEATRQADLARLLRLAEQFDGTAEELAADLTARFGAESEGRGVHLLTYHRAKGLEWDAVFLPLLVEGELPARQARSAEALAEERRLLYVGITRARRRLHLTWGTGTPSRFLEELGVPGSVRGRRTSSAARLVRSTRCVRRAGGLRTRSPPSRHGGRSGLVRTASRPTSSSTTARSRRSPGVSRAARPSCRRCPASGRRSSSATAPMSSGCSRPSAAESHGSVPGHDRRAERGGKGPLEPAQGGGNSGLALGVPVQRGDVADLDRREAGSGDGRGQALRRIGLVARGDDVVLGDAGPGPLDGDAGSARDDARRCEERARPVAREQDERAFRPQEPPPLP